MKKYLERTLWVAIVVVTIGAVHIHTLLNTPVSRKDERRVFFVPRGASFGIVARGLERAGLIRSADNFIFVAGLIGAHKRIQAGEYELSPSMTPRQILSALVRGRVRYHSVTIPEGYNIKEIASTLEKRGLVDREEFLARTHDRELIGRLGLEGESLEGYLFPDTYLFTKGMTVEEIIVKMVDRFKEVYNTEFREKAQAMGLTMKEVVTLASIIEKETSRPEERAMVSSVFHNRLRKGIPLQSDPTVIYGIEDFDGNLTKQHLLTRTPYNTYLNPGLPPTPIANPGKESIYAALHPSMEDYLYFVSRNDGTHHFSRSLEEHNRAVNIYQKGLSSR